MVPFQCEDIQPGYIFQENSKSIDSAKVAEMQSSAEGNHPCADVFFKDGSGALYLVDAGGASNMSKALNQVRKMNDVLIKEGSREDLQVSELKGVVLLPNIVSINAEDEGSISEAITVTGARARRLLGGLAQLFTVCLAASRLKPKAGEPNQSQGKEGACAERPPTTVSRYSP